MPSDTDLAYLHAGAASVSRIGSRAESAGRMWVVLPALLPGLCAGWGVASEAWVPA